MNTRSCDHCGGTGYPVVAKGSGLARDYNSICPHCGGRGFNYIRDVSAGDAGTSSGKKSAGSSSSGSGSGTSSGASMRGLFGTGGFIGGLALGNSMFDGDGMATFITAVICAWLAAALYKLVVAVILLVVIGAALAGAGNEQAPAPAAAEVPAAAASAAPVEFTLAPGPADYATPPVPLASAAPTNYIDPVACVQRSFDDMFRLFGEVYRSNPSNDVERLTQNEYLYNGLAAQDVGQCPQDYRDAYQAMVQKIGVALTLNRAFTLQGGSQDELEASWREGGAAIDAVVAAADRHVPGMRARADKELA